MWSDSPPDAPRGNGDRCGRFPGVCMTNPGPCPLAASPSRHVALRLRLSGAALASSITRDAKPNAASQLGRSDDVSEGSITPFPARSRLDRFTPHERTFLAV